MSLAITTAATTKTCQPFNLDVMVFSPEAGFKFEVSIDRSCSPQLDPIWKFIFDLYKKNDADDFDHIVHVAFTANEPAEQAGIESMAVNGVSGKAADKVVNVVFPAAKALEGVETPTDEAKATLHNAIHETLVSAEV